jgi:uncharacterized protein (TIRG00374 family)
MSRKRLIFLIASLVLGIVLILLWLRYVDIGELLARMRQIRTDYVVGAAIAYLVAYFIRSWRWNLLLNKESSIPLWHTYLYSMGGNWINYLIPIRAGEVVKAWFVKRNHGLPIINVLPSIFIDKTFDTLGIFFVLMMIPLLKVKLSSGLLVLLILLGIVFLISLSVLFLSVWRKEGVVKALQVMVMWLPRKLRNKANGYIGMFVQGLNVFEHHWSKLLASFLLTALGVGLDGLYFYLLFLAFGVDYPFVNVLFGYTLINLSYALPQPPAQLGSNEWMMIIIFSVGFTLTRHDASAIMAFAHMLTAILIGAIGLLAIALSGHQVLRAIFRGEKIYEQ